MHLWIFIGLFLNETAMLTHASETDLQARWFGVFLGLIAGVALFVTVNLVGRLITKMTGPQNIPIFFRQNPTQGLIFLSTLTGYTAGALVDSFYVAVFSETLSGFWLIPVFVLSTFLFRRFSLQSSAATEKSSPSTLETTPTLKWDEIVQELSLLTVFFTTIFITAPQFQLKPREIPEGIYIYANDVVYDWPILNIYTSRLCGMTHTGLCFVTRDPERIHAECQKNGFPVLRFERLENGYWLNDLNLDVADTDGFTNYASRTKLDDFSYPFDLEHWNHFLAGRSVNDRLHPAIRVQKLETSEPLKAWSQIVDFKNRINEQYPNGFVYSPIPFHGRFANLYNCNTLSVGIADKFLQRGAEAERLTHIPGSFGGQRTAEGRELMHDYQSATFSERIRAEREFLREGRTLQHHFLHWLLYVRDPTVNSE